MNLEELQTSAAEATELLRALANEKRLTILCQLIDGERNVGDLSAALGLSMTNASQQLALLRKDGLVATRRDGKTIYYALKSDAARRVIALLYEIYCAPASEDGER